ncbi:ATP-binding protein [Pseudomonas serbica]|uniref:ATP-binding protein n=1 Tax=Pseudomonas serbica TaxID=2965074 RepID=UPI00237C3A29|nr:ATP-binding protein [Pseudomonas serbica]
MNPNTNPFTPGAGMEPPKLAGRDAVLDAADVALHRTKLGKHANTQMLVGMRGVGKTTLLNRIRRLANDIGYIAEQVELREGDDLDQLLIPVLRSILLQLKQRHPSSERVNEALRVLRSFIGDDVVTPSGIDISLCIEPEDGVADSGMLDFDVRQLMIAIGTAAREVSTPVVILFDELHHLRKEHLTALLYAIHALQQIRVPVIIIGAGLPQLPNLVDEAADRDARNIDLHHLEALSRTDVWTAIKHPIGQLGRTISDEALWAIEDLSCGIPYLLQAIAYHTWNSAKAYDITEQDVKDSIDLTLRRLDQTFYRVYFERTAPVEQEYLRSLANMPAGSQRSADVAKAMKRTVTSVGPVRDTLIKKGLIYSPEYGFVAFTAPLFADFMKRQKT